MINKKMFVVRPVSVARPSSVTGKIRGVYITKIQNCFVMTDQMA